MPGRIHIFGASGSGTSSLAAALAARHGHRHVDTDDYFWLPTEPPYQQPRRRGARHEAWLLTLPGAVLRLEGARPVAEQLARIECAGA